MEQESTSSSAQSAPVTDPHQAEAKRAAAAVLRHESDCVFLRGVGRVLDNEAMRRRINNLPAMTPADAAALVANYTA